MSKPTDQPNLIQVLQKRADTLRSEGKLTDAIRVTQTAVEAARKNLAEDESTAPEMVSVLYLIAELKRQGEDYEGAESAYVEALSLATEKEAETAIPSLLVARIQSGLASLYDFTSREDRAAELYQLSIQRLEANEPPGVAEAATLYNNVAMIFKEAKNNEQAEHFKPQAHHSFEKAHGDSHETVATVLNNLGGLYTFTDQLSQARECFVRSLAIRESTLAKDHPDVAQSNYNLAVLHHKMNDFGNARKHYDAALKIYDKDPATHSEDLAILLTNYADLLRDHGQAKKADGLQKRLKRLPA